MSESTEVSDVIKDEEKIDCSIVAGQGGEGNSADNEDACSKSFPLKLMDILSDEQHNSTISWLPHGYGFQIHKKKTFADTILPHFFKASKFTSFTRKLNRWGFNRAPRGPETGAYFHKLFLRDKPELIQKMSSNSGSKVHSALNGPHLLAVAPSLSAGLSSIPQGAPTGAAPYFMPYPATPMPMLSLQQQQLQWQQQMQLFQFQQMQQMQLMQYNPQIGQCNGFPMVPTPQPMMMMMMPPQHMPQPQDQYPPSSSSSATPNLPFLPQHPVSGTLSAVTEKSDEPLDSTLMETPSLADITSGVALTPSQGDPVILLESVDGNDHFSSV